MLELERPKINYKVAIEYQLKSTKRKGINNLLEYMEQNGFYEAPASTRFHGSEAGALARHSYNVLLYAEELADAWLSIGDSGALHDSIIICSLLHDLGKIGQFNKPYYVDNILKSGQSKTQPYKVNPELTTLPHEVVSVIEASRFIKLTEQEQFAIAYHNGLYTDIGRYALQGKETPLQMIIHFADLWESRTEIKFVD